VQGTNTIEETINGKDLFAFDDESLIEQLDSIDVPVERLQSPFKSTIQYSASCTANGFDQGREKRAGSDRPHVIRIQDMPSANPAALSAAAFRTTQTCAAEEQCHTAVAKTSSTGLMKRCARNSGG
jgi:hypothetical protein